MATPQQPAFGDFEAVPGSPADRRRFRLEAETLRGLTRLQPGRAWAHIAAAWLGIAAAVVVAEWAGHLVVTGLAVVWIGARQHALGVMAHDGAHFLIHRDKAWNDWITRLLLAWPVGMSLEDYRRIHALHHRHLNDEGDPDWVRNRPDRLTRYRGPREFLKIMLGLSGEQTKLLRFMGGGEGGDAAGEVRVRRIRLALYAGVVVGCALLGILPELLLYWVLPLCSWFLVTMRLKGTAEHFAVENREACNRSRTLVPRAWERWLIAPANVHYHIEHHLYPSVPFYHLPALHAALWQIPAFRESAHMTTSYAAFLGECLRANRGTA